TAYYYEYLPTDRLAKDIEMMKKAHLNIVRIGESTWGTYEKQSGVFDFSPLDKVLDAMGKAGISVIVGTPTYAIPTWLAREHPEIMVQQKEERLPYGARQIMDITSPAYLFYGERIIRKMLEHINEHPAIIGYQVDNETKSYGTSSSNVQAGFVKYIKKEFNNDIEKFNREFGLDYWSNRINSWEDFPSMDGTINGSLGTEFAKYQRQLVTDYLKWQVNIVNEYKKSKQFVTHNF
ncbi:beta-galactosidase, partial [Oenococcus oeni]